MNLKRMAVVTALFCLFLPSAILADSIDFGGNGTGPGSGWSWSGGVNSSLTATGSPVTVSRNGGTSVGPLPLNPLAAITWTTGGAVSGNGSISNPYVWAPGGTITIMDGAVTYFSGTFSGAEAAFNAVGALSFVATGVSGNINPLVLALLLFPPGANTSVSGSMSAQLLGSATFAAGGSGSFGSTNLTLAPVPEPAALSLVGSGALGLAALLRRRRTV